MVLRVVHLDTWRICLLIRGADWLELRCEALSGEDGLSHYVAVHFCSSQRRRPSTHHMARFSQNTWRTFLENRFWSGMKSFLA